MRYEAAGTKTGDETLQNVLKRGVQDTDMVRITELKCRGLYSYREPLSVAVPEKAVIVGPNNSGKSNIFRLIRLFEQALLSSSEMKDSQITKGSEDPYLELRMELSKTETGRIVDFFSFCYDEKDQEAKFFEYGNRDRLETLLNEMRSRVFLKKTAMSEIQTSVEIEFVKIGFRICGEIGRLLRMSGSLASDATAGESREQDLLVCKLFDKLSDQADAKDAVAKFFGDRWTMPRSAFIESQDRFPERAKAMMSNLHSYMDHSDKERDIIFTELVGTILAKGTIHSPDSRNIDGPTIWTVAESLKIQTREHVSRFKEDPAAQYNATLERVAIAKSEEPAKTLAADGSNLSSFLLGLKTSDDLDKRERFEEIQEAFKDLFISEKLSFDVIITRRNLAKQDPFAPRPRTRMLRVPVTIIANDELEEQFPAADAGAGVRESLYLLALVLGSSDSVVLLDEPSINMHPSLAREILGKILGARKNQILVTTHSPAIVSFVAFENPSKILYVRKTNFSSTVHALDEVSELHETERGRLRYTIDPGIFFAKCVVLVEGESDKSLMTGIWRLLGLGSGGDLNYNDILVVPVCGKKNFPKYRKVLAGFGVPYLILADNDAKDRVENGRAVCKETVELGGSEFVIENGNLEDLMRDIDPVAHEKAAGRGGKIVSVHEFMEELRESGGNLNLFRAVFNKAVSLAK